MEVFAAIVGVTDVSIRTSSKLWKLSSAWRDAPENLHRLRDDITRTHQLFAEIQQNVPAQTRPGGSKESPSTRTDLKQLLGQGVAVLRQIEAVVEKLSKEENHAKAGEPQELGKRRKLIWIRNERKVADLRKELRGIIFGVCNVLITENVRVSAETNTLLKALQSQLQSQIGDQLQTTSERIVSHTDGTIQRSESMIVSRVDEAFGSSRDVMLEHMDHRLQHLAGDIVTAVRQSVADEMMLHQQRVSNTNNQLGHQETDMSNSAAWASFVHHVVPFNSAALDETCHCRSHFAVSSYHWSITLLHSVMGSITVVYSSRRPEGHCHRNASRDHRRASQDIRLLYHFPTWLLRVYLSVFLSSNLNGSPQMNIRVSNHLSRYEVPSSAYIIRLIGEGDTQGVKKLLAEGRASVHDVWNDPCDTPLWNAMVQRKTDIVRVLLQAGADPYHFNPFYKASPISAAVMLLFSGKSEERELVSLFPISDYLQDQNYSTLHLAVGGILPLDLASALCQPHYISEVDQRTGDGRTPLVIAASRGDSHAVRLLLEAGASIKSRDSEGSTALHMACRFGHYKAAQCLLMAGIGVDDATSLGITPLQLAVRGKYDKTQNLLSLHLQYGADVNHVDSGGDTVLFHAVEFGMPEAVQFLINHGANINFVGQRAVTALAVAVIYNRYDIIEILLECGAETHHLEEFNINGIFCYIASYGDRKTMEIFTTRQVKGIDVCREPIPPGKSPQQYFNERNPTPELRRAFESLIASLVKNGGSNNTNSSFEPRFESNAPDDDSSDDEFVDAEEELE